MNEIKQLLAEGGGRIIIIENDKPAFIVMSYEEYKRKKAPVAQPTITEQKISLTIITNFNLVTKKFIDKLLKSSLIELLISVWAATPETYVKTHPNQNEKIFENARTLAEPFENAAHAIAEVITSSQPPNFSSMP